jgi:hypothetical protein
MTRKPSALAPTAEDISRHEEEVAAFLNRQMPNASAAQKSLPVIDQLCLALGKCYVMESDESFPHREEMTEVIDWILLAIHRERDIYLSRPT